MRVYIETAEFEAKVMKETNGLIGGYPLVFTVLSQDAYTLSQHKRELERAAKREKEKKKAESETAESTTSETV